MKIDCNLCGYGRGIIVVNGHFGKIAKCKQCGLMFRISSLGPELAEHVGGFDHLVQRFLVKQKLQLADYEKCFPIVERHLASSNRNLLEIGSNTGEFLNLAHAKGWKVKGIEPNEPAARKSIEDFGLNITISDLCNADLRDESFDVVVMFHVIEHFNDPVAELSKIYRITCKGGILVVETPRFDTLWFKILKERERNVFPDHLFYFTRKLLVEMIKRAGFSVLRLDTVGRTLTLDHLITTTFSKIIGSKSANRLLIRISDYLDLGRFKVHLNMRDIMRVYAQKN